MGKPRRSQKVAVRSATPKKAADKLTDLIKEIISNLLEGKAPTIKRLTKLLGELASGTFCLIPITSRTVTKSVTHFRDRIVSDIIPAVNVTATPAQTTFPPRAALQEINCTQWVVEYSEFPEYPRKTVFFGGKMLKPTRPGISPDLVEINAWPGGRWVDGSPPAQTAKLIYSTYMKSAPTGYICKGVVAQAYTPVRSQVSVSGPVVIPPEPPPPSQPPERPGFVRVTVPGAGGTEAPGGFIPITRGLGSLEFATRYTPPERRRR